MSNIDSQIVQSTGYLHNQIGKADFGIAKQVFDTATALHAGQGVLDNNPLG